MSRLIDQLPEPAYVREKKVIVTSRSRSGTFSLYQALQMLGYRPYHMYEVVQSTAHMGIFEEALNAKYYGVGKPYGKAEFDKWFADYDTLVEIPAFFVEEIIAAYPNATFIHVDRDVDKWVTSMTNVLGTVEPLLDATPMKLMATYDLFIRRYISLHVMLFSVLYHGRKSSDPVGQKMLKDDYLALTEQVKTLVPPGKLGHFSLEDEFGWEQICPRLSKPIPDQRYPRGNAPKEFKDLTMRILNPSFRKAAAIMLTTILVPIVGFSAWLYRSRK